MDKVHKHVQSCLLGYTAVENDCRPTFQRCVLPPSSRMSRSTIILHGSITQKTTLNIILAAVRTLNLHKHDYFTYLIHLYYYCYYYYYYDYEHD
jgi:hypothetical protein